MDVFAIVWLVAIIVLALIEAGTTQLVAIWFVVGSVGAFIANLFNTPLWVQLIVFVAVSILSLALTRPFLKKYLAVKKVSTNADRYVGETAIVTDAIDNSLAKGQVKVLGSVWTARSADGSVIAQGARVKVEAIDGVKLIVVPVDDEDPQK